MHDGQFLWSGPRIDSTVPAVVAGAVAAIVRDLVVVDIVNDRCIHIRDRGVVVNPVVVPIRALIATTGVSETVVDAAIIANVRTPVARVPMVIAVVVAPPRWGPQRTHIGG